MGSRERQLLLDELNRELPSGIDWKRGAAKYIDSILESDSEALDRWHLTKPFLGRAIEGGPFFGDPSRPIVTRLAIFEELYPFLNVLKKLAPDQGARILDVGCGPGWTTHFLAKLGYRAVGFDISDRMLEFARKRMAADLFPPHPQEKLDVELLVHDIEGSALPSDELFDFALFDSALHHFFDPISALENVGNNLEADAVLGIIEFNAPPPNSPEAKGMAEIMQRLHTLERPYTRPQMAALLREAGFSHAVFLQGVNGCFETGEMPTWNSPDPEAFEMVLATRTELAMRRIHPSYATSAAGPRVVWGAGFYPEEQEGSRKFRWCDGQGTMTLRGVDRMDLVLQSDFPFHFKREQVVYLYRDGERAQDYLLAPGSQRIEISLTDLDDVSQLEWVSDGRFRPEWIGADDRRSLSFTLEFDE
jgi:SAM-dependent methyltransferase